MAIQQIDRGTAGNPNDRFKIGAALDTAQANDEYLDSVKPTVIDNFAALASTPVVAGKVYNLKEYHAGTGYGGGDLEAYVGVDTPDNGTIFATATAGTLLKRINADFLSVEHFGAIGDNINDDTLSMQRFLDKGYSLKGRSGRTYKTTNTLFATFDNVVLDFSGSTIDNKSNSLYAIVACTSAIGTKNEANLLTVMSNLHYGSEVKNVVVKNLNVEMSAVSSGGNNLGVGIVYGMDCRFENVNVKQTNGNGCEIRNSTRCGTVHCNFTPRTYGSFNFQTKDCFAYFTRVAGCARGIITKHSQAGSPVGFNAFRCTVEDLTNTLYYTAGGEWKERDLTDPIYQFGHEIVSDVHYTECTFRSSNALKVDLSYWASGFKFTDCTFRSASVAGIDAGLSGNQIAAKSGVVNTSGVNVTHVSGDNFAGQTAGTSMVINGVTYTIQSRTSDTAIILTSTAGIQSGVAYSIAADTQGKNHQFIGCKFYTGTTVGNIACSIGADATFLGCEFNGSFQRLIRAYSGYNPVVNVKSCVFAGSYEGAGAITDAIVGSQSSTTVKVSDCEFRLTVKAGSGSLVPLIYNADVANDNTITVSGSSSYSAYPITVSTGTVRDNKITANGFNVIDGITINDAALVHDNELTHDGTSTGTARAIYGASGSVQVRDIFDNKFSGWDSNSTGVLGNNTQYPTYADEAAAVTGSLASGRKYKSSDGIMRVKA